MIFWEISFWNSHFSFMWSMYVGITKGKSTALKCFVQEFEADHNVLHTLLLFHYLIETNSSLSLSKVFVDKTINLVNNNELDFTYFSDVIQPHHMHALVAFLHQNWEHYESLLLINVMIPADSLNVLHNFFLFYPEKVMRLKYLWLENNRMFPSNGRMISTFIAMGHLEELRLIRNKVDTEEIGSSLADNHTIKHLVLSAKLTHININPIIEGLSKSKMLVGLDLSGNCIGSKGGEILAKFLNGNPTLKSLNLADNMIGLSEEGIEKIKLHDAGMMDGRYDPNIVTTIPDLSTSDYDHTGTIALATALRDNNVLESLELSCNFIKHSGVEALAYMLQCNATIQSLDLSDNELDMAGAEMIADAIHINSYKSLVSLDISSCNIGDAGMCKLCITNLETLNASDNELNTHACKEIAQMLKKSEVMLYCLELESNNINNLELTYLASAIKTNKSLKCLYLRDNLIGDLGAAAISLALKKNTTLESLDLSMNYISDEGAYTIFVALSVNSTLKVLFVPLNPITMMVIYKIFTMCGDTKQVRLSTDEYAHFDIIKKTDRDGVDRVVGKSKQPLYHFTVYLPDHENCTRHVLCSMGLRDYAAWKVSASGSDDIELPDVERFIDDCTDTSDDYDQE